MDESHKTQFHLSMSPSLVIIVHSVVATIWTPEDVDNWLDKFGMERHQIHCSGRTKASDLLHIVKEIDGRCSFRCVPSILRCT